MEKNPWRKSPPALIDRFHETAAGIEGVEVRQMFGFPAGFIGGNMAFGLHQDSFIVRLPDDERQGRLEAGWMQFEPMHGRPMREYLALPSEVVDDANEARAWAERAAAYVLTLPAKVPKPRKGSASS
jgi:TfoX/Sxy family transcriptional regulator of competence genes